MFLTWKQTVPFGLSLYICVPAAGEQQELESLLQCIVFGFFTKSLPCGEHCIWVIVFHIVFPFMNSRTFYIKFCQVLPNRYRKRAPNIF